MRYGTKEVEGGFFGKGRKCTMIDSKGLRVWGLGLSVPGLEPWAVLTLTLTLTLGLK